MAALITPTGPKRRFWSLLTPSKEFTLKLPLRRAFAGERAGPVAKQREGEVVGVPEAVCGWTNSDPPHPASPPAKTRAERGMSISADICESNSALAGGEGGARCVSTGRVRWSALQTLCAGR